MADDFVDTNVASSGTYHTAGVWTGNPSNTGGSTGTTTFTDSGADFKDYMIGWLVCVNIPTFAYLEITARTGTTITVKGDASGLSLSGDRYWIFAPPHVDPATGAMRGSYTGGTFKPECDSRYLWGLYRYMPPMVGYYVDPEGESPLAVYGGQDGTNQAGWYDAGARRYDPGIGRWTTPDPAMSPWECVYNYVQNTPLRLIDPTGLACLIVTTDLMGQTTCEETNEEDCSAHAKVPYNGFGANVVVDGVPKGQPGDYDYWKEACRSGDSKWKENEIQKILDDARDEQQRIKDMLRNDPYAKAKVKQYKDEYHECKREVARAYVDCIGTANASYTVAIAATVGIGVGVSILAKAIGKKPSPLLIGASMAGSALKALITLDLAYRRCAKLREKGYKRCEDTYAAKIRELKDAIHVGADLGGGVTK